MASAKDGTWHRNYLDEYQPSVSNLMKGRISQVSIEKLLRYADRMHLQTTIAVRSVQVRMRHSKSRAGSNARPVIKRVAVVLVMRYLLFSF